ncbi:hypothetical protein OESDEN_05357 [Oesophagostomum dentatum]|uniref:Uncharacterized protein n=1 Tax=Oesophagostomum dentatum TaxID=61180 RepID=A0A0B1TF40_OESDE|nr:hypothetical protein OESDEN_05357 [Oesophagostomum dentatum]
MSAPFLTYMNNFWPPSVYFSVFVLGTVNLFVSYNFLIETKGVDLDDVNIETAESVKREFPTEKNNADENNSLMLKKTVHEFGKEECAAQ